MNQEERKTAIRRMRVLVAAACILMLLYGLRLIFLQLVNGDDFKSQATNTTDYKFTVTAARGDIVDSRGERIATSVTGYNVVLNKLLMGDEDLDGMLQKIVELLRANGESWNDTLLISQPDAAGNYTFTAEEGSTRDQKALAAMKDNLGLQQYATANDVMEKLVEDYDLTSFPLSWQRTLGGIHYEMQLQAFSNVNNFIMAENVSEATVATIKEHSLSLPGVEIVETSTRSYEQSTVLPHVLGRVGKITAVPEPGHTVQLTIDSRFQKAVDKALAENIDMINRVYNTGSMKAAAGAAVVLDVKDGSVLAASNYPSFDQNLYATQYSEYSADESLPLFNRALQGLYTPGSTFKPAVAIAALDTGLINRYSTVNCTRVYTYYKDYRPKCTQHGHGNGPIDVVNAIKWSCNVFFYDVGRRLTSDVYDAYAYKLGLGQRTGVEVSEAVGHLTSKNDSNYMESLDIQAAIGQGNTVVTPVQLATYAATIANRGTRYRTHFVKAILDSNTGEVLQETQPEVMDVIEDKGETFDLIQQGMIGVSQTISALANYPYTIACKTGTPQRSEGYYSGSSYRHYTNTMMIAYGPTEDAQIAIGIVVEYGGGGARAGNLMADIFNAYFAMQDGTLNEDGTIGKQETAADSTPAAQTAPAQTETGADAAADTATDPAAGTTDAAQETAPAGQDALDN